MTKYLKSLGASLAALIAGAGLAEPITKRLDAATRDKANPLPVVVRFATILREAEAKAKGAKRERIRAARVQAVTAAAALGFVA